MARQKTVFTTGQVAKICNVAPRTVSKWFDSGQLHGYRIPGSKDRRIPLSDLISFMQTYGIPLDGLDIGKTRVLVLDSDMAMNGLLKEALASEGDFEVSCARTAFEAGVAVQNLRPSVLVVDVSLPDVVPEQLCRDLRANESLRSLKLIAVSGAMTKGEGESILQAGFHACLRKPFEVAQLVAAIDKALGK